MTERRERTSAEWITFAIAAAILSVVIAAIGAEAVRSPAAAQPVARVGETRAVGDAFHVEVTVTNRGDDAASEVQVVASLEIDGETTDGDQTIDFLAGDDAEDLVFVFADDPDDGELTIEVTGFTVP